VGLAPGSGSALGLWAKGRTRGIAQKIRSTFTAGQSHRLTSGGKAVTKNFVQKQETTNLLHRFSPGLYWPAPLTDLRNVVSVLDDVLLVVN
jgi:hypothetical protein